MIDKIKTQVPRWILRLLLIGVTVVYLYPFVWNLFSSFKTNTEYLTNPFSLPSSLQFDNYVAAIEKANILSYLLNSVYVVVLSTVFLLLFTVPISYVLSRYKFRSSKTIITIYMACIFLQATYIMIPLFLQLSSLNALNNLTMMCLVYAVMQFPFAIFTLHGFISGTPVDFEEAARIDGASNTRILLIAIIKIAVSSLMHGTTT